MPGEKSESRVPSSTEMVGDKVIPKIKHKGSTEATLCILWRKNLQRSLSLPQRCDLESKETRTGYGVLLSSVYPQSKSLVR